MKYANSILSALAALAVLSLIGSTLAAPSPSPAPATADAAPSGGDGQLFLSFQNRLYCRGRVNISFSDREQATFDLDQATFVSDPEPAFTPSEFELTVDGWRAESNVTGISVDTSDCNGSVRRARCARHSASTTGPAVSNATPCLR